MMGRMMFVAPLLVLLWACAPTVEGGSARDPLRIDEGSQVEADQGSEQFLGLDYALEDFGLERADLGGSFWIPAGVNEESANLSSRFALQQVRVPAGWSLELAEVRAHRTVETRYGRETGVISYRILPVLRVQVPSDARLGVTTLRAELLTRGGDSRPLEIPVRVRAPATTARAR
jgi:hypothetical protein